MAITLPLSLQSGTPEQKARAYATLRNQNYTDAQIAEAINRQFGTQASGDLAYLQQIAQPFITRRSDVSFPTDVTGMSAQDKINLYNNLRSQGFSDADIRSKASQLFGIQSDADWNYLTGKTGSEDVKKVGGDTKITKPGGDSLTDPLKAIGESKIDPVIAPYLEEALGRARSLFLTGQQPTLYPGQMYVSPSEQTLSALSTQEALARAAQPSLQASQEAYNAALGGMQQTAQGGFLQGSPYQQQMIEAATRPLTQQFSENVVPTISSQFSKAGRYGSGAMERALGTATESFGRALGDVTSNIVGQDYARERGFQQEALAMLPTAASQAPQFFAQQFLPSQALAQVGAQREAIAGQPLQEAINRYNFEQQIPYSQLSGYLSSIYGSPLGNLQQLPQTQNSTLQNIGGFLSGGAALYSALPSNTRNSIGNWLGGIFG
jgi:hypothetical protein